MDKKFREAVRADFAEYLKTWEDKTVEQILHMLAGKYRVDVSDIIRGITKEPSYANSKIASEDNT